MNTIYRAAPYREYFDMVASVPKALKRLQAEAAAELDALLPALLDRAFNGEL